MKLLTETNTTLLNVSLLLLRLTVGIILFLAGAGKVLGWFGGMGIDATLDIFVSQMGIHPILAYLSCYTEFIGGFLLIVGLLTRPAAFAIMINMLVAGIVTLPNGFMAGASYPFSMMVSSIVILLAGPMAYSLDAWLLSGRKEGVGFKRV
ncbi:MAG TPA: DoxX family protein [Thermodesulfobacteriota bacterium]|nr:DoxX family protein [Thermodesulfobacteriota bacterium]